MRPYFEQVASAGLADAKSLTRCGQLLRSHFGCTLDCVNAQGPSTVTKNLRYMRCQDFSPLPRRERRAYPSAVCEERATPAAAKKTATRRAAPDLTCGFVAPQSQSAAAMLLRRASPPVKSDAAHVSEILCHSTSSPPGRGQGWVGWRQVHGQGVAERAPVVLSRCSQPDAKHFLALYAPGQPAKITSESTSTNALNR